MWRYSVTPPHTAKMADQNHQSLGAWLGLTQHQAGATVMKTAPTKSAYPRAALIFREFTTGEVRRTLLLRLSEKPRTCLRRSPTDR